MKQLNKSHYRLGFYSLLIICFTFSRPLNIYSQGPTLQWQKALGGSDLDWGHSICNSSDGGSLIVGSARSTNGNVSANHSGNDDIWAVKLSSSGALQWEKSYGCLG